MPEPATDGSSPFRLSKWYLDCVADNGDGAVIYIAELGWRKWRLRYSSLMLFLGNTVTSQSSLRSCALPESSKELIVARNPHLAFEGTWKGRAEPVVRKVYSAGAQEVVWNCLQPASDVRLVVNSTTTITGRGYAELLQMSIAPWTLPLSELHWGRWIGARNHLVWIQWNGIHNFSLLVHNGISHEPKNISQSEVTADPIGLRLTLDCGLVLRRGDLGKTVLPVLTPVLTALPQTVLRVHECKWRSRGVLATADGEEQGWAIHEIVRWPHK